MKKIMMSLGMAVAVMTGFKTATQNNQVAAAEPVMLAKLKKKKTQPKITPNNTDLDLNDDLDFYKAVLKGLGVNETPEKIKFLQAWRQGEGGMAKNNPFNTSKHIAGTTDTRYNSHGVRNYPDRETGLAATIATLKLAHYKEILDLLKKDDVTAHELAHTKALKKWGTGPMVAKVLAAGKINPPDIA